MFVPLVRGLLRQPALSVTWGEGSLWLRLACGLFLCVEWTVKLLQLGQVTGYGQPVTLDKF